MATLSTFQKFKEEQEKKKQGGQQSNQQSTQQSGQKSTGLMNSYQQFIAKQQGQETAYTPESDYGQRVMDVIGKVGNSAASRNGEWTADASGGNAAEINALLREYDAYTGDKSGMTEYRNALLDYNKRIQAENQYYAGFGTKDDFNRVRSGYTNFGVGYDPQSYGLDDASARKLRQESAQNDAKEAQRALAELNSARKNFAAVDSEWRAMDERYRSFTIDEYDKDLTQRWQAAKDQVTAAENALLNSRNRMDAYNATWGKVDKYGETSEAAKGTDTSYTGPGYESIADWENKKNEEQAAQDAQAQRPDYVPGALRYTSDTEPVAEDRLGLWRSLTPEQKQDAVSSSNMQLNNVVMAGNDGYWDLLTDNEVETYYYIKGQQGQEAANQYLDDMYIELSRRNEAGMVQGIENASTLEKTGMVAASVGANLVGAIPAAMGTTADLIAGRKNPYSSSGIFKRYASYVRGSVGQDISDWTEDQLADKYGEAFAAKAGEFANQTFQAFMSGVDSMAGGKFFGQGLGIPVGPFDMHVGGYTTVMGLGAFADRAQEMQLKGATTAQIALGAIGSGVLEALFEDVSMEAFFTNILDNPATTLKEFTKKLAVQMGVEASEEVFTEIGNILWDGIVMGKNSDTETATREYMAQGMTEQEARQRATLDNIQDIVWAGYGGAISAGAMAAGGQALSSGVNRVHSTVGNYAVGSQLLENGRAVDLQEQAASLTNEKKRAKLQKAAADVANKASTGDKSFRNTYRTGKVATQIAQQAGREARGAETAEFRKAAEKYLEGQRGIQNKKHALNVLTRVYDGTAMLPGDKAYMRMIGGEKLTQEILNSVGGKETLQENARPSVEASMRTIGNVQSSVLGIAPETKAEFDSDNSGQAFRKSDSEPINILAGEPIARVENGVLYLNTDDGQEIAASDVSYGNSGEAAVYAAISNMQTDTETARSLLNGIDDSGLSSAAYARAIRNAYYRGMNGVKYEDTPGYSDAAKLPETQRRAAWEAGKQRRAAKVREQSALIDSGKAGMRESGVTMQESAKSIRNLNKQQQTGMAAAKALAAAGLHVEVYASTEAERKAGKPNGIYRKADGSIAIDLNAGDNGQGAVAYALAHEMTHFIQDYSPAKFETYAELIIAAAESKGISYDSLLARQLARLSEMEEYKNLSETELQDIAYDETIAEMSETILTDTDAANRLSQQIYKQDRTLWQKIKDFFTGLVEKLRNAYRDSDPDSDIGRMLKRAVQDNAEIAQAWAEAVSEAGENYQLQDGQKNNAREGERYSARQYQADAATFAQEIDQWNRDGMESGARFELGSTGEVLQGLGAIESDIYMNGDKIQKILQEHPEITLNEIKQIPQILNDPTLILKSRNVGRGGRQNTRMVLFGSVKGQNGMPVLTVFDLRPSENHFVLNDMQKVTSAYTKTNGVTFLENSFVLYADKKRTTSLLRTIGFQMPIELLQSGFIGNITYNKQNVNLYGEKFSDVVGYTGERYSSRNARDSEENQTETENFKKWFGDWQNDPASASKVVNEDGTPKVLYHQTSADFTIFEPRHEGAGTRDQDTPFGIFMKSSDRNIGVKGEKQMALYARIVNPLRVTDRADLMYQLKRISPEYEKVSAELRSLNDEYQQKYDDAKEAFRDYITKWRQKNPNASRTAIYDDAAFNEVYEAEDNVLDEWEAEARKVELRSKEAITRDLEKQGYDGVIIRTDKGSFGRSTDAYIALHPEQVKSATDNIGTFDKANPDIRYSSRNVRDSEGNALTENQVRYFENSQVRDDEGNLKVVYHGSPAIFTEFSADFMGTHGSAEGQGFYFTDYKPMAEGYQRDGGQLLEGYLNIQKPLSDSEVTLKRTEVRKLLQALDPTGDDLVLNYDSMGGMGYPSRAWYNRSVNDTLNAVMNNESDSEILGELANAMGNYGAVLEKARSVLGYDGYIVSGKYDNATVYVVFDSSQFKNADNQNPTEAKDIRYSSRNNQESRVDRLVRKNEELKAEAEYLKQVVQIQKQGNRKNLRDRESVNAIAKGILESVNAKDTEFGKKLNDFYRDLATVEMDYDTMQEKAGELADRALEHHQAERDGYAQEVLDFLKKRRVSLTESQIGDAEYTYGSLSEFKKAIKGSIIIDQNSTTSLDQLWQEAAARFPDRFDAETVAADMPDGIVNIVSWANSAEADNETEFHYYKAETKADLTRKILMGFLDAKPIESVSDTLKQQLADLKQQHKQEMKELRKSWDEEAKAMERSHRYDLEAERKRGKAAVEALKYQQEVIQKAQEGLWETERADIKRSYEKQMRELKEQNTQKAHEKVESRHRTEERHKLQNTIDTLNRMLLRPTNTSHVPQELQSSVAMAMKVINGVILDSKTGQNADRLAKYAEQLRKLEGNPEDNAEKIADLNRKIGDLTGRDISMKAALTSLQEQYAKLEGQDGGLYDSNIEALIEDAKEAIGNTAYKDLSLKQLKAVRDTYTALLTTIRNANKAFVAGQNARIDDMVKRATIELSMKGKKKPTQTAIGKKVDQFFWNNEKPVYAFERIGSAVMSELYRNLRNGEDTFYRDVNSAREFFLGAAEKDGFDKWNLDELQEFEASNGQKFQLSLDERMSLYAYSLRPQARDHLTKGGIVLAENTKRLQRGPLGVTREVTYDDANAYTLTDETIDAIVNSLTKEQRQFAFEMQQYLAKVMGAKGDEVNMAMYGIKKFGEETYWPLKSSGVFSERIREQQERTGNKVKNSGFTKALTQHANNAIELSSLTETWAQHVNDMSMYHAFVLPMEDFYRVYNWTQKGDSKGKQTMGVRQMIQQTAGKGAVTYIDQFLKDLNGGLRADPRETVSKAMLSGFKKAAVSASLSVAIQQPSAVGRALAYIEANYFVGGKVESAGGIKATWDQLKKYAAVAGLKEMGRFDVDMGQSTLEYIIGRHSVNAWGKFKDKVDKYSGWLPEMADQVTWCAIWEAAKRKTAAQNPGLKGEALLQKAGELFTDTITRTQVYDSVFSRSANMRAKSGLMSMATAFMAEPTTTANMVEDAVRKFAGGDKRMAWKVMSSVAVATVLNAALASVVYAARDDDDDKTYWEKYMASLAGETVDSLNPLTYIPVLSDINNLLLGYSIERTDMSLASDLITALKKITTLYGKYNDEWSDEEKKEWKKKVRTAWLDNAWMVGTVMGLPLKNVVRDVEAVINTARNPSNGAEMNADTVLKAMGDSARKNFPILSWKADESSSDQLYKAITQGKDVLARRLKAQFGDEKKYESALLKGLRENDPRIKAAAQYAIDGNTPKRVAIIREIVAEGHYTQDQVIKAINQKANSMKEKTQSGKESPPEKLYDYSEYVNAAANGLGYAGDVQKELIRYQADRNQEADGKLTRQEAESDALKTFQSNVKSDAKDGYAAGELTEAQVRKVLTAADIAEDEELDDLMLQWDTEMELGDEISWSNARYLDYAETIHPAGISADTYDSYIRAVSRLSSIDEDGDGKTDITRQEQVIEYIDSMPISDAQKDTLFQAEYPKARKSVLRKLPWR